jgi:hypothetical protein
MELHRLTSSCCRLQSLLRTVHVMCQKIMSDGRCMAAPDTALQSNDTAETLASRSGVQGPSLSKCWPSSQRASVCCHQCHVAKSMLRASAQGHTSIDNMLRCEFFLLNATKLRHSHLQRSTTAVAPSRPGLCSTLTHHYRHIHT